MITKDEIVIIKNSEERDISAEYFTMQYWKYRNYKLKETGKQNSELQKLKIEFLAEFAFMEYLCNELSICFDGKEHDWSVNKAELTDRNILLISITDAKSGQTIREKTIDLKTHYIKKVTVEEILGIHPYEKPYSVLLEHLSYPKTDIIVHAYLLTDNSIALAGYQKGLHAVPGIKTEFYTEKKVNELLKMKELIHEFY
jgi:hypothetical protein